MQFLRPVCFDFFDEQNQLKDLQPVLSPEEFHNLAQLVSTRQLHQTQVLDYLEAAVYPDAFKHEDDVIEDVQEFNQVIRLALACFVPTCYYSVMLY